MLDVSSLLRLCANKPAPTRSTRESAACTTTRPRCKRDAPEATFREPERSASAGCAWAAIQAGATPNRMPVRSERAKAKPITRGEGAALMGMFCAPGKAIASSMRAPAYATARPTMPPSPARRMLSVSNWRMMWLRCAPKAVRTHISPRRLMLRTSCRLAMLAQATRRTRAAIQVRRCSCDLASSCNCWMPAPPGERTTWVRPRNVFARSFVNALKVENCWRSRVLAFA